MTDVSVKLDDRVRLLSAVLAATTYPDAVQAARPHGTHLHARATRKRVLPFAGHEAAQTMQGLLEQGAPLEAMYMLALLLRLPDGKVDRAPRWMPLGWDAQLGDFYAKTDLPTWWNDESAVWNKALTDSTTTFQPFELKPFLQPFVGDIKETFLFIPNISYPTDQAVGIRLGDLLVCIAPPRLAWGDSPPWPYNEDPAHLFRVSIYEFGRLLMMNYLKTNAAQIADVMQQPLPVTDQFAALHPTWVEQFTHLFTAGAAAIYLEDHVSAREANAFVLMERKVHGLEMLPGVINVLRRYLRERESGRYQTILELLPNFAKQMRVANRIVSL